MDLRKTPDGAADSGAHKTRNNTASHGSLDEGSNLAQKVIFGLIEAGKGRDVEDVSGPTCLYITINNIQKAKKFRGVPCNLESILGSKWNFENVFNSMFPEGTKPNQCLELFCSLFKVDKTRVSVKDGSTIVLALEKEAVVPTRLDSKAERPSWVDCAANANKNLSSDTAPRSEPNAPAPEEDNPSPPKKQKTMPNELDKCLNAVSEELSEKEIGQTRLVLEDLISILDGNKPGSSHLFGKDRVDKTKAGTLFALLMSKMGGGPLLSAMSHLFLGNEKLKSLGDDAGAATAAAPASAAAEVIIPQHNGSLIDPDESFPDEVAQCITDFVLGSVKKNDGGSITLSPALSMAYGAMTYAQVAGSWTNSNQSRVIEAKTGLLSNHWVRSIVLPTEHAKADPAKTAEESRHKKIGDEIVHALPPATQIAVMYSAIRAHPDLAATKVGDKSPEEYLAGLRLSDEESEAISTLCEFSWQQQREFNRSIYHAKGIRLFSAIDKRRKVVKASCSRVSAKFGKVKLKERVKGNQTRDRLCRRYDSSMMEVMARDVAQLEENGLLLSCEQRLNKPEWNDSIVYGMKIDRGGGSTKVVVNNICVAKPQSLAHTKLVKFVKLAKDTYENLRDGIFSPKDKLKQETEDLMNNKSVALIAQYDGEVRCVIARHSGKKRVGNIPNLPKPNKSVRVSADEVKARSNKNHRFDFEEANFSQHLRINDEVVGIAFCGGNREEIGRMYFDRPLRATTSPHSSSGASLKQKKLRGFISADFELLSNIFGHVGGAAMRSCLWCEWLTREYSNIDALPATKRTRENIAKHFCEFTKQMDEMDFATRHDEKARKQHEDKAHQDNGSIRNEALLDIDPSSCVCMPLHIILGITKKLNEYFNKCLEAIDDLNTDDNAVDNKYALKLVRGKLARRIPALRRLILEAAAAVDGTINADEIQTEIAEMAKKTAAQKNAELLKKIGYDENTSADIKAKVDELAAVTQSLEEANSLLEGMVGPFEREFFLAKKDHGVDETVYHQDFVGNDCFKFCQEYPKIFRQVQNKVEEEGNEDQKSAVRKLVNQSKPIWKEWAALVRLMKRCDHFKDASEVEEVKNLSLKIPRLIKAFTDNPPVNGVKLTYPQQVKLHCLAALHLYYFAKEYNTIGIISEESGESIHNRWNRLIRRFVNRRGEDQEKGAVLELERSQNPKSQKWIEEMREATARYSAEEKEQRKAARESANEVDNEDDGNEEDDDHDEDEGNQINAAVAQNGDDDGNDDDDDDGNDADFVQIQCPHCNIFLATNFLSLHIYHTHSSDIRESVQRLQKSDM